MHFNRLFNTEPGAGQSLPLAFLKSPKIWVEEEMATHSSIPAWKIPWTEKPGGLQSMGLQRVRHDSVTWDDLYFIDENAEAQRGKGSCRGSSSGLSMAGP